MAAASRRRHARGVHLGARRRAVRGAAAGALPSHRRWHATARHREPEGELSDQSRRRRARQDGPVPSVDVQRPPRRRGRRRRATRPATCWRCWASTPGLPTYTDYRTRCSTRPSSTRWSSPRRRSCTPRWCGRPSSAGCTSSARSRSASTRPSPTSSPRSPPSEGLVTQVGYHYRFVGAFAEVKRLLDPARSAG